MSKPTHWLVIIDGKTHPHAFTVRFMARLFRNAQRVYLLHPAPTFFPTLTPIGVI